MTTAKEYRRMATGEEGMGHFLRYQGQPYLDILFKGKY
jgi:hypothetical protein